MADRMAGWRRARVRSVTAVGVVAFVTGITSAAAMGAPVHRPLVETCHGVGTRGAGNAYGKDVSRTTWARTAVGHGTFVINSCRPNCAAGRSRTYPATVRLDRYMNVAPIGAISCEAVITSTVGRAHGMYVAILFT